MNPPSIGSWARTAAAKTRQARPSRGVRQASAAIAAMPVPAVARRSRDELHREPQRDHGGQRQIDPALIEVPDALAQPLGDRHPRTVVARAARRRHPP
jgi:hypothetical protein